VQRARVAWEALLWHITAALSLLLFPTMLLPPALSKTAKNFTASTKLAAVLEISHSIACT